MKIMEFGKYYDFANEEFKYLVIETLSEFKKFPQIHCKNELIEEEWTSFVLTTRSDVDVLYNVKNSPESKTNLNNSIAKIIASSGFDEIHSIFLRHCYSKEVILSSKFQGILNLASHEHSPALFVNSIMAEWLTRHPDFIPAPTLPTKCTLVKIGRIKNLTIYESEFLIKDLSFPIMTIGPVIDYLIQEADTEEPFDIVEEEGILNIVFRNIKVRFKLSVDDSMFNVFNVTDFNKQ